MGSAQIAGGVTMRRLRGMGSDCRESLAGQDGMPDRYFLHSRSFVVRKTTMERSDINANAVSARRVPPEGGIKSHEGARIKREGCKGVKRLK